jgi:Arc/MetJ-type ribon-helix-helix transcriptional regulator
MATRTVRLPDDLDSSLERAIATEGASASEVIRRALRAHLGKGSASKKRAASAGVESEEPPPAAPAGRTVRVTFGREEIGALERRRLAGGFASVAHYTRAIVRAALRGGDGPVPPRAVLDQLAVTNTYLAKLGGNINQIARALNADLKRGKNVDRHPQLAGLAFLRDRIDEQLERQHKLLQVYEARRR